MEQPARTWRPALLGPAPSLGGQIVNLQPCTKSRIFNVKVAAPLSSCDSHMTLQWQAESAAFILMRNSLKDSACGA
jgi:hypothetical protein